MKVLRRSARFLNKIDGFVWGVPLIVLIILTGIYLTIRVRGLQVRHLGKALKFMVKNRKKAERARVTSFGAFVYGTFGDYRNR